MAAAHRRCSGGHVELGEDALGVGAQRVERDVQLTGDLRSGELAVQKPEYLQFAVAQEAAAYGLLRLGRRIDGGRSVLEKSSGVRLHKGSGARAAWCRRASIGAPSSRYSRT